MDYGDTQCYHLDVSKKWRKVSGFQDLELRLNWVKWVGVIRNKQHKEFLWCWNSFANLIHTSVKTTIPHQWVFVNSGGGYPSFGAGVYGKNLYTFCESKTALKSKMYFKKVKKGEKYHCNIILNGERLKALLLYIYIYI